MSSIAAKLKALKNANYRETEILKLPNGIEMVLSTLTGEEDREMADYLMAHVGKSFGHYTKLETLAYAVKWIKTPEGEEIDLRGQRFIETGETLDDGTPQKERCHRFMRGIINTWPDVVIDAMFARFAKLCDDLENDTSSGITVELGDDALLAKIYTMSDQLKDLIREARNKELEIPEAVYDFSGAAPPPETEDRLKEALAAQGALDQQEDVHPIDEQLAKERAENPEVYPVPPKEETPTRVRK